MRLTTNCIISNFLCIKGKATYIKKSHADILHFNPHHHKVSKDYLKTFYTLPAFLERTIFRLCFAGLLTYS